jgi:hypothetical protein
MPSTSTSVKSESPPRGKSDVSVPGPPVRATVKPGTVPSAPASVVTWRASSSRPEMTVTLSAVRESG